MNDHCVSLASDRHVAVHDLSTAPDAERSKQQAVIDRLGKCHDERRLTAGLGGVDSPLRGVERTGVGVARRETCGGMIP